MAKQAAEVIIKKGRRCAAANIQEYCHTNTNCEVANEVFDSILNPEGNINDWDTIEWCRWLLAGGRTPEDFAQTGKIFLIKFLKKV